MNCFNMEQSYLLQLSSSKGRNVFQMDYLYIFSRKYISEHCCKTYSATKGKALFSAAIKIWFW